MPVLEVRNLVVEIGGVQILRGVSFDLDAGETLGVAGESGCGKSMTAFALMGMLPRNGKIVSGSIKLNGRELVGVGENEYLKIRGKQIALVMQDPFTSLNPMMRVGAQIEEAILLHQDVTKAQARKQAIELIEQVGVPAPAASARKYPHQMSGGQRQRIVIAMAFACQPMVLLADEPTTALDVTLQAQILRLLRKLQEERGVAVMMISHDIGTIASVAKKVAIFYAGKIVEMGPAGDVLLSPKMPYTQALLGALPDENKERLISISGQPPSLANLPVGCAFSPRCQFKIDKCNEQPNLEDDGTGRLVACWRAKEDLVLLKQSADSLLSLNLMGPTSA